MNEKEFVLELNKLGIDVTNEQLKLLNNYYEMLIEKNKVMNLTNITLKEDVYLKHFYDSLTLNMVCNLKNTETICDIGTGAGFPGIVLKIMFPHLKIALIDSLEKRTKFLKEVVDALNLKDVEIFHVRAEDYAKDNRDKFDIVTSRAVAKLSILTELCLPLVKKDGYFISMKGNASEEIEEVGKSLIILNSEISEIKQFLLPYEESQRTLIKIKKKDIIDKKYPRDFKEIKRKPL